jgi:hypothetical protein
LIEQVDAAAVPLAVRSSEGRFRTSRGSEFRLPSAEHELSIANPAELMACCILSRGKGESDEEIEAAMESVAPLIDLDLDAPCPECGKHQTLRFSIQSYLLEALLRNRNQLLRDVHRLAFAYGWSLSEILTLGRNERKVLVELVETEKRYTVGAF